MYQGFIKENDLADSEQIIDFSSTYVEGNRAELAEFGYSRDKRPDRKQITFGISTGMNNIPTALTIQKGNTQDKKHLREMLKLVSKVIPENSLLIFDAGANTKGNRKKIRDLHYHYLTLKPKKVGPFKRYTAHFRKELEKGNAEHIEINNHYSCVKVVGESSYSYIFFSLELYKTQIKIKEDKFRRQKEKGNKTLRKRKPTILPSDRGMGRINPPISRSFFSIDNPYLRDRGVLHPRELS